MADLTRPAPLARLNAAQELVRLLGVPAVDLLTCTTNEPAAATVRALEAALRARYASWAGRVLFRLRAA